MIPRLLPAVLALLLAGDGAGPAAAPDFDPEREAVSWSLRQRREIVDGLAARLRRGETKGWTEPGNEVPADPHLAPRFNWDVEPEAVPVTDRLASWVPADAAAALFESLTAAETQVGDLANSLPGAFPVLSGGAIDGDSDALARSIGMLLLPPIWRANPEVRRGIRQAAIVASDPDLRGAPDVALLCEVDDATLVRTHRLATFSWEDRSPRRLVVQGLDARTEDGAVRSFFALEGGVAVWSTTRSLRDRILAAGAGRAPSLLRSDPRAWRLARRAFPAAEGGALVVVPDGFIRRNSSWSVRAKRAAALRCEASRLILDAGPAPGEERSATPCPSGGRFIPGPSRTGSACSIHGTVSSPVPLGDLPPAVPCAADVRAAGDAAFPGDPVPVAAWGRGGVLSTLIYRGPTGRSR